MALGRVLSGIDWSCLHNLRTCDDKFSFFNDVPLVTMDIIMPIKEKRICTSDAPWMTEKLKSNIRKRQKSLKKGIKTPSNTTPIKLTVNEKSVDKSITGIRW